MKLRFALSNSWRLVRLSLLALGVSTLLTACGEDEDRVYFDGVTFRAKARKVDDNLAVFRVEVHRASKTYVGALQAGVHEGTRYCIKNFGSSRIDWAHTPETLPAQLVTAKDTFVLRGECKI